MKQEAMERAKEITLTGKAVWDAKTHADEYAKQSNRFFHRAMEFIQTKEKQDSFPTSDRARHYRMSRTIATKTKLALEKLIAEFEAELTASNNLSQLKKTADRLNHVYRHYAGLFDPNAPFHVRKLRVYQIPQDSDNGGWF